MGPLVREKREARLRVALKSAADFGRNSRIPRAGFAYETRGYMTVESEIWPKEHRCLQLPDERWVEAVGKPHMYRPDEVPAAYSKMVITCNHNAEIHKIWKVASTSLPVYIHCAYGHGRCVKSAPSTQPVSPGASVAVFVRNPLQRFLSAADELFTRALDGWCVNHPCADEYGGDFSHALQYLAHSTSWYNLLRTTQGNYSKAHLNAIMQALVDDTACGYYTYAAEHFTSQATFATQNDGEAANITAVVQLEHLQEGLAHLATTLGNHNVPEECHLPEENPASAKTINMDAMRGALLSNPDAVRSLCLTYAQDFICFGYALPEECKGMF